MMDGAWPATLAALDTLSATGRTARFWLRDDDAVAATAALERLAETAARFDAAVLTAVIPLPAQPVLARTLAAMPNLLPCPHGHSHRNHAPTGAKAAEFGAGRDLAVALSEIAQARARLDDLFGQAALPVFVPPWNRIDPELARRLPEIGLTGLSCFRGFALPGAALPIIANTHLDLIDWRAGRIGRAAAALDADLAGQLAAALVTTGEAPAFGLLLHHRDHDAAAWANLESLLARLAAHPAARLIDPRQLFFPDETG